MQILTGSAQGRKNAENEDHYFVREFSNSCLLFGVADGIGSHPFGGSVAKWLTKTYLKTSPVELNVNLRRSASTLLANGHAAFVREFDGFDDFLTSGCTISLIAIDGNRAVCLWAGDSPVYYTSPTKCQSFRVSTPHNNNRGELTECFNGDRILNFEIVELDLEKGDVVTVASDGVIIDKSTLLDVVSSNRLGSDFLSQTLETSTRASGSDDSTMICYQH